MIHNYPAKITIVCTVFLLGFIVLSSVDVALSLSIAIYFIFFRKDSLPIFIASVVLFLFDSVYRGSDVHFRFITDLSIDAYILFLSAVIVYFKTRGDIEKYLTSINQSKGNYISKKALLPIISSIVIILLFLPVLGGFLSLISGYVFYCFIIKQFNGKIAVIFSIGLLIISAGLLLTNKISMAEQIGDYAFFFLVIGSMQEIIIILFQKISVKQNEKNGSKNNNFSEIFRQLIYERKINNLFVSYGFSQGKKLIYLILSGILLVSFILYFYFSFISKHQFPISVPRLNINLSSLSFTKKIPTPTLLTKPTVIPTPTPVIIPALIEKISTSASQLKISVLNGTNIQGLASSTSAKLKKAGFLNIEIGNVKSGDYKNWEVSVKKSEEDVIGVIKNVLSLETLIVKEATSGAIFDIVLITGEIK